MARVSQVWLTGGESLLRCSSTPCRLTCSHCFAVRLCVPFSAASGRLLARARSGIGWMSPANALSSPHRRKMRGLGSSASRSWLSCFGMSVQPDPFFLMYRQGCYTAWLGRVDLRSTKSFKGCSTRCLSTCTSSHSHHQATVYPDLGTEPLSHDSSAPIKLDN